MALAMIPQNNIASITLPPIPGEGEIIAMKEMAKVVAYSGFLTSNAARQDITQRTADAFFVMMYGRELGIPAMISLRQIYVIDGKPSCSGQLLLSLVKRAGVDVEIPDPAEIADRATIRIRRPGGEWKTYTYTLQMAKEAGLVESWNADGVKGKKNWKSHWREMLIWRAFSTGSRFEVPDITGGLHTLEEISPNTEVDGTGSPLNDIFVMPPNPPAAPPQSKTEVEPTQDGQFSEVEETTSEPPAPPQNTPKSAPESPTANAASSNVQVNGEALNKALKAKLVTNKADFEAKLAKLNIPAGDSTEKIINALEGQRDFEALPGIEKPKADTKSGYPGPTPLSQQFKPQVQFLGVKIKAAKTGDLYGSFKTSQMDADGKNVWATSFDLLKYTTMTPAPFSEADIVKDKYINLEAVNLWASITQTDKGWNVMDETAEVIVKTDF